MGHQWWVVLGATDQPPVTSSTVLLGSLLLAAWGAIAVVFKKAVDRNEVLEDRMTVDLVKLSHDQTEALTNTNSVLLRVLEVLEERERGIRSDERAKVYAEMAKNRRSEDSG